MKKITDKDKLSYLLFALNRDYYEDNRLIRAGGKEYTFDHQNMLREVKPAEYQEIPE